MVSKDPRVEKIRELMRKANEIINENIMGVKESNVPLTLKLTESGSLKLVGERRSWCNVLQSKMTKLEDVQREILVLLRDGAMIPDEWLIHKKEMDEMLEGDRNRFC